VKPLWILVFALPLMGEESGETIWYDSEGKVARVEGPDAECAEKPFVAEWRKREIERRERSIDDYSVPFKSGTDRWGYGGWHARWMIGTYSSGRYGCFSPRSYSGFYRAAHRSVQAGSRVIIRW